MTNIAVKLLLCSRQESKTVYMPSQQGNKLQINAFRKFDESVCHGKTYHAKPVTTHVKSLERD
jgi:hypothetical protein